MSSRVLVYCALVLLTGFVSACKGDAPGAVKAAAIRSGDELMEAQKYAPAAAAYRRAVGADPNNGALRFKLAKALEQSQQWTPAANEAMRAADLLPHDFDARFLAARLILGQSRFEDSLTIATALLRERPGDPDLLVLWGTGAAKLINSTWALFKLGPTGGIGPEYEKGCTDIRPRVGPEQERSAEATLRRAVELAPNSVDARLALINFLWAARRADESVDLVRALADEQPLHGLVTQVAGYFFLARHQDALGEKYLVAAAAASASYTRAPRLALADHYLATGRFAEALTHLAQMTPADDEGGVISARKADAELRLGQYDNAATQLDAILAKYPKHRRGLPLKAQLLLKTGKTADALVVAREAVASDSTSSESRVVLAETLSKAGDPSGAFLEYGEALRLDPALTRVVPILAQFGLATGRNREALVYARQATGLFPDDMDAKMAVVTAQVRLRDYAAAALALGPLLQQVPRPSGVQVQLGLLEAGRGNEAAARSAFDEALRLSPASLEATSGLVALDLDRGRVADASARVARALAARPNDAAVLTLASLVYRAEGDTPRAEQVLRQALALRPGDADVVVRLAECLSALNRDDDARRLLEQALRRRRSSVPLLTALGLVLERLGRVDDAQARYQNALSTNPGDAAAAARLALLYVARGMNLDVALAFLAEALRTSPDDPQVSDALGWVYLHKGIHARAVQRLEDATRGNPRHAGFQYHLGVAYARAGQISQARATLTKALALDVSDADRTGAEAALAALPR